MMEGLLRKLKKSVYKKKRNVSILTLLFFLGSFLASNFIYPTPAKAVSAVDGYYDPTAQGVPTLNMTKYNSLYNINLGYVGADKIVKGNPTHVNIVGLDNQEYGAIISNVTVERMNRSGTLIDTVEGQATAYANLATTANAGYVMVDLSEALEWIKVLNGNPNYVFGGSIVHEYSIRNVNTGSILYNKVYNLAEIAAACGGQGVTEGDGLTQINSDLYEKHDKFRATPRPDGGYVRAEKDQYTLGQTAKILKGGVDYSIYDKGLKTVSVSVYNKTLGKGYEQKMDDPNYVIQPDYGAGTYEISYVFTDNHGRTPQGSPSISNGFVFTDTFEVVAATTCDVPINVTLSITGQSNKTLAAGGSYNLPQGVNTIGLTFPVSGKLTIGSSTFTGSSFSNLLVTAPGTTISFQSADGHSCWSVEFIPQAGGSTAECSSYDVAMKVWKDGIYTTNVPSGEAMNLTSANTMVDIESTIQGDFFYKFGGSYTDTTGWTSGASNKTIFNDVPLSSSAPVLVKFVSSTGQRCWYYKFDVVSENQPIECPKVYQPDTTGSDTADPQIANGSTLSRNVGDTLKLYAKYYDPNTDKKLDANLLWKMEYPDHTVKTVSMTETGDGNLVPGYSYQISTLLNQKGTYTLWHDNSDTSRTAADWTNCTWSITIVVDDTIECSDLEAVAYSSEANFQYTGTGTSSDPYTGTRDPGEKVWTTFEASYQGNRIPANWEVTGGNLTTPIVVNNKGSFQDFLYPLATPTTYTIKATITYRGITCVKIFYVTFSPYDCSAASISAKVNGTTESMQNETLNLILWQSPSYKVDFTAKYSGVTGGVTADWILKKNGTTGSKTVVGQGTFSHTFTDTTPGTYTLTVNVKIGTTVCPHTITINLADIQCSDLHMYYYNGEKGKWLRPANGGEAQYIASGPLDWKVVITDSDRTPDNGGTPIQVTWSASLSNQSATPATYFEHRATPKGIYTVTATVNDPSYPQLAGCQFTFTFEIQDSQIGCSGVHYHLYDSVNQWTLDVANGSTVTINADHVEIIGVIPNNSPNDYLAPTIDGTWTGSKPNEMGGPEGYRISNVGPGTYSISGTLTDTAFPNTVGCTFTLTIIVGTGSGGGPPAPGGDIDGGKLTINLYDSTNRKLVSTADGTWEREPARIEVLIDQSKINTAFNSIDGKIKQAIDAKIAEFKAQYPAPDYENVVVTAQPPTWNSKTNAMTRWPASVPLSVVGPGINSSFSLNPKVSTQSNTYTGTITPTLTTWNMTLNSQNYVVQANPFTIDVPYSDNFNVTYDKCEMVDDPAWTPDPDHPDAEAPKIKQCTPGTDSGQISESFAISVQGAQTSFEVYEPNAKGLLEHTAEWAEYHARDRYPNSHANDFYAGERMISHLHLEGRHRHPISGQLPRILTATAWISEIGKNGRSLQSNLSLLPNTNDLWIGPKQNVPKLGQREIGVDTPLMGDKLMGFAQGGKYAVYFQVEFAFGVTKGFSFNNKTNGSGHPQSDYSIPFAIIANAWERQGIRNHTKQ